MTAEDLIETLRLQPHPEGGWYRETWRAPAPEGGRAASTAILFLLKSAERSHWHRVDADEIWLFHEGDAIDLSTAECGAGPVETLRLGAAGDGDALPQRVIRAGHWQAADPADDPSPGGCKGYSLVSCVVAPGFEFAGFTLAAHGWEPGR